MDDQHSLIGRISPTATSRFVHSGPEPPSVPPRATKSTIPVVPPRSLEQLTKNTRRQNYYIDTPTQGPPTHPKARTKHGDTVTKVVKTSNIDTIESIDENNTNITREQCRIQIRSTPCLKQESPIVCQPRTIQLLKDFDDGSIICPRCNKCRCVSCVQGPRELPSHWVCNGRVKCSVQECVEAATCMCCVRGVFYHCFKDSDADCNVNCDEHPCSCCAGPHCFKRWICMAFMTVCLPCLLCYLPLHCLVRSSTFCYNRSKRNGCQCHRHWRSGATKRLLIVDTDTSASSTSSTVTK